MNAERAVAAAALVPALALALCAPGCLYIAGRSHVGPRIDPDAVARIHPGETTRSEVLAALGPPNEYERPELTTALLDDDLRLSGVLESADRAQGVYTWQHDDVSMDGTWLLVYLGMAVHTESDLLVVFFDERGVVLDMGYSGPRVHPEDADGRVAGEPVGDDDP
ncbi:MAG: hypothetical protein H6825_15225 [Planctomycetes bacterium]|nr:hypothetical protein [Planctomycetota bacterium]